MAPRNVSGSSTAAASASRARRSSRQSESSADVPAQPGTTRSGRAQVKPSYAEDDDEDDDEEEEEDDDDAEGEDDVDAEGEEEDASGEDDMDGEGEDEDAEGDEDDDADDDVPCKSDLDEALFEAKLIIVTSRAVSDEDGPSAPSEGPLRIKLTVKRQDPPSSSSELLPPLKRARKSDTAAQAEASSKAKPGPSKSKKAAAKPEYDEDEEDFDEGLLEDDAPDEEPEDEMEDDFGDDLESMAAESSRRSNSPSKLTARQRAKGNQDLQETLIALPMDPGNKKMILTEAEKLQRKEETARNRKRQSEQKIQDEMDTTINRLLRAQTNRSRNKLEDPSAEDSNGASARASPSRRGQGGNTIRWQSQIVGDSVIVKVAAPLGKEDWIAVSPTVGQEKRDVSGVCAVSGCGQKRIYRSTRNFDKGGCSMAHLKTVEASL